MKRFLIALLGVIAIGTVVSGQIPVPYTFTPNTTIQSSQVNTNFSTIAAAACNLAGCTMTGTFTTQAVQPAIDATYALGSGSFRYTTGTFSGLVTAGSLTSTGTTTAVLFSGSGASLTSLNASNLSSGTCAPARGCVGIDTSAATDGQLLIGKSAGNTFQLATLTAGSGVTITNGGGAITVAAAGATTLLGHAEGSDTHTAVTTLATFAISGLTVRDTLHVQVATGPVTQGVASVLLYHLTDNATILPLNGNASLISTQRYVDDVSLILNPVDGTNKGIMAIGTTYNGNSAASATEGNSYSGTAPWTGSWSLGLVSGGVTSGGTLWYRISVWKVAGQ